MALVAVRAVVAGFLLVGPWTDESDDLTGWDVDRFHEIATEDGRPYVDFEVEYPPGSLALIEATSGGSTPDAQDRIVVLALAADLGVAALVGWRSGRRALCTYLVLGGLLLPTMYLRFDVVATLGAVAALAALWRSRGRLAGALLTAAFLVKTWPAVLLPLLQRSRRAVAWAVGGIALVMVVWVAVAGVEGPRQVATFRGAAGWHIESAPGAIVHAFTGGEATIESGSYRFGTVPDAARVALLGLYGALWIGVWVRLRGRRGAGVETAAAITLVSGLLATSTLLSPQFLTWLLPFAAVAWARGDRRVAAAPIAAIAATGVIGWLFDPPSHAEAWPQAALLVRNGLLVVSAIVGWHALRPRHQLAADPRSSGARAGS